MQLSDVLKQIQPCDMEEPYIFISYSARDQDRVWRDVLRFQQMGYNVWLDEKNLDKTQPSWRSDALTAIRDMNCSLLVFYVSQNSLVSQPCYSELSCTVEDYTKAVHFGPVKFIAVDVEPINDIVEFSRNVYAEIRRKDIPKSEKTTQAITLNNCIEQFFNSNNEKVRVKPFDIPNRKMDYYEEITAAFPDDTRVLPVAAEEAPVPVANVPAAPVKAEPVIPEPVRVPAAVPVKEAPVVPAPAEEVMEIPEDLELNFEDDEDETDTFRDLGWEAMDKANTILRKQDAYLFKRRYNMSEKQKKNAISLFGDGVTRMDIVGMLDPTMFGSGKEGCLLTEKKLYSSWNPGVVIELFEVEEVSNGKENGFLHLLYRNGSSVDVFFGSYLEGMKALIQTYVNSSFEELQSNVDEKEKQEALKKAAYWKEFGFGDPKPRPRTELLPTDPVKLANFAFSEANREIQARGSYGRFEPAGRLTEKQLRGAVSAIVKKEKQEDILGMMDDTLFKSGKGGIVLTKTALYSSWAKKNPVNLGTLIRVEQGKRDSHLLLTYEDGYQEDVFFNNDYLAIKMILQVYIDAKNQ